MRNMTQNSGYTMQAVLLKGVLRRCANKGLCNLGALSFSACMLIARKARVTQTSKFEARALCMATTCSEDLASRLLQLYGDISRTLTDKQTPQQSA